MKARRPSGLRDEESAAPGSGLSSVRIPKTAEVVADQIRKRIIRGELKEGDFLPPEGQLMENLAISRPTLRETFRILETERLISVVRGSRTGARVHRPQVESVARYAGYALQAQGTTIADIYQARLAIEPFAARLVAEAHRPEDVARLKSELSILTGYVDQGSYANFLVGLARFHRVVVDLSGNRTLLLLTNMLEEVLEKHQLRYIDGYAKPDSNHRAQSRYGLRSFEKLIRLIEAGDAAGAEAHFRLHIENANRAWLEGIENTTIIDVMS